MAVGRTYTSQVEFEAALDDVLLSLRRIGQDNHWVWREGRSALETAHRLFPVEAADGPPS